MAIDKPTKPTDLMPRTFGGEKNNFSDDLIASGFEPNMRETYNGDNLNYQLDATGKELDYCEKVVDYINGLGVGKTPIVNSNNKLDETQVGLKVYSATETYSLGEWVRSGDKMYQSLTQGNLGNDLTNETYWKEVEFGGLPSQTGKNEKFLKTDGEQASWEDIPPATMLNIKKGLMRANGKKVQFVCSEGAPVTVKTTDGTTKTVSYIPELDLSSFGVGSRTIALGENGNAKQGIFENTYLTVSTDGWVSGFAEKKTNGYYHPITYPTIKEEIFPITFEFKANTLPTNNQTIAGTGDQYIWAVNLNATGTLQLFLGATGNTTWGIASGTASTEVVEPNVPYLVTIDYDGATYTMKVRNMVQEGATDITFVTVASTTLIAGTSATKWGHFNTNYFDGYILGQSIKVGTVIDNSDFLKQSVLGTATLTADGITNITNNYQTEVINPLQAVTVHTKESYAKVTEDLPTNLDLIPFTFVDIEYSSYVTISANTSYTLTKDVMVNTSSISTFTITKDGATYTVYGTWLPVRAGTMFKSSVAGKYYSFEGY